MGERLTDLQRQLLDEGHALVVHCNRCDSEHFLGRLPMDMGDMVRITRRVKCPTDKTHKLLMGPLSSPQISSEEHS